MRQIKTSIIPHAQTIVEVDRPKALDKEAICVFAALGFFLDQDTYWKHQKVLPPASDSILDANGFLVDSTPWFKWHYSPRDISFDQALEEFTTLFETIIDEQVTDKKVVLPISGGLDSRSQAAALKQLGKKVSSYSYEYKNGFPEAKIAQEIAEVCGFPFQKHTISEPYLWNSIEKLAEINGCYSEFTHPRQMAIYDELASKGEVFSLGHWGDVLFDDHAIENLREEEEVELLIKKVVRKGGMSLANALWEYWKLEGSFSDYLYSRLRFLLEQIPIKHSGAKIRAFKSLYWAPRWTSINLAIFESARPITLPYYDDRMCEFICSIPEKYLANRALQIAYIKQRNAEVARVQWQSERPFNLFTFTKNKSPYNVPYRIIQKGKREWNSLIGKPLVQRNWELQFVGKENDRVLQSHLFNAAITANISEELIRKFYNAFTKENAVTYSHPVSMLLTLSLWFQQNAVE